MFVKHRFVWPDSEVYANCCQCGLGYGVARYKSCLPPERQFVVALGSDGVQRAYDPEKEKPPSDAKVTSGGPETGHTQAKKPVVTGSKAERLRRRKPRMKRV